MQTLTEQTVGAIAAEVPAAIGIFEKLGIDYCCGGGTPLAEACASAGVTIREFEAFLAAAAIAPDSGTDWTTRPLSDLQAYLVGRFHAHAREELDTIVMLTVKVVGVHGERHAELQTVAGLVDALREDMLPHMMKEEMILFPYVEQLESSGDAPQSCFGTVGNPIRVMMMEHEGVGDLLRTLRSATSDYTVPEDACFSYRELYRRLEAFERETHEHIHLENNIHFPRALELERGCTD